MEINQTSLSELYSNRMGSVLQDDQNWVLVVRFAGTEVSLNLPCFACLKKSVDKIDLQMMAEDVESDVEIVTACGCERCYILTLTEAFYLKDLLAGAKTMLELNSIIHSRLYTFQLTV